MQKALFQALVDDHPQRLAPDAAEIRGLEARPGHPLKEGDERATVPEDDIDDQVGKGQDERNKQDLLKEAGSYRQDSVEDEKDEDSNKKNPYEGFYRHRLNPRDGKSKRQDLMPYSLRELPAAT